MNKYKFTNIEGTAVIKDSAISIVQNGKGWNEYLDYVAEGGETDPWKTDEEILEEALADKLQELKSEKHSRVDATVGTSDPRKKDRIISRSVKLLRRETKGTATAPEIAELDQMETLDGFLDSLDNEHDAAEAWLEDSGRTLEQIQGYDVAVAPGWSTL